jgi:hypothetical protein
VSLGDDIARRLPALRALAESTMRDSCVIAGAGAVPVWDDETGTYSVPTGDVVYEGKCRLRMPRATGSRESAGEASWAVDDGVLSLPVAGSQAVGAGHVAVVSLDSDPMASVTVTVQATHVQTDSTARRLPVKVVARDA